MDGPGDRDDPSARAVPLDETLEAPRGRPAEAERRDAGPSARVSPPSEGGRRRVVDSPERDYGELLEVDPEHYAAGHEVARGGMGRIVAARDRRLGRVVAIKELIHETEERVARFEREALITARLQHPAIVNVHEAGRWPSGQPFYAMKMVAGRSLAQLAGETRSFADRLALVPNLLAMVEAVAHAHQQRIIHRDLKPSNVLVGDLGETVVIDWGLAKDLADEPSAATHTPSGTDSTLDARGAESGRSAAAGSSAGSLTIAGSVMGTPGYMPAEQAAGEDVDERADVYALGAILYHLLGGVEPYRGETAEAILAAVRAGPPAPLSRVEPRLPSDLIAIVEKAMAREPNARYRTALQLAQDLRRFQTGQLVAAHSYSRRELAWRFVGRHRAALVAAAIALSTIFGVGLVSLRRILAERDRAEAASVAAAQRADELAVAQAGSLLDEDPRAALDVLAHLSAEATPATWRAARMVASDARMRGIPTILPGRDGPLHYYELSTDGETLVSAGTHVLRVWDLRSGRSRVLGEPETAIVRAQLSPDRRRVVTAGLDGRLRLWPLEGGAATELGSHEGKVTGFDFSPDGERLISCAADGAVRLWQPAGSRHMLLGRHQGKAFDVDISDDGSAAASVGEDGVVHVWPLGSGSRPEATRAARELRATPGALTNVTLSADGTRVAAVGPSKDVWLWHVASGKGQRLSGHDREVWTVAFSPDGRLATAGADHSIRLWDSETGESEVLRGHTDGVNRIAFARGSDLLFSSAHDGTTRVWMLDGRSGSLAQVFGGNDRYSGMYAARDGSAVVGRSGSVLRHWQVTAQRDALRGHRGRVTQVEFTPTGALLSGGEDWSLMLWPAGARTHPPRVLAGHQASIAHLAVSPDGRTAVSIDSHRLARLWDLASGSGRELPGRAFGTPRFSPDGGLVAAPSDDHAVRLWSTATGEARLLTGHTNWVVALAFSPDGRHLASASADRTIRLWSFATGAARALVGHENGILHVEFAGSEHVIASDVGGSIREWNVTSGASRELRRMANQVLALATTRSGDLVAWADGDEDVYLWNRRTGQSRVLVRNNTDVVQLLFAPDGRTLLGRDDDSRIILWDTATDAAMVLPSHGRKVSDVAISPNGTAIATADSDRSVRLWPYDLPHDPARLRAWLRAGADANASAEPVDGASPGQ